MATSNRDRVGKMFELMAPPLDEFITRSVAPALTGDNGASWPLQLRQTQHEA